MSRFSAIVADPLRWGILVGAVVVAGSLWIGISQVPASATTHGAIPSPREGFAAPDFTLETLAGESVTLSDLRGKAAVVNLWASWCPPCRAEMPALQAAYEEDRDRGLEILAVDMTYQDRERDVQRFAQQFGLTFTIALDRDGTVARQYLMRALPSTFFIGPDGVIEKVVIGGPMSEATIRSTVSAMLQEVR